jgi:hypothetical protein
VILICQVPPQQGVVVHKKFRHDAAVTIHNSTCDAAAALSPTLECAAVGSAAPPHGTHFFFPAARPSHTPLCPYLLSVDVREHFENMKPIRFVSNTQQTYTCVDARGDDEHLSTPG